MEPFPLDERDDMLDVLMTFGGNDIWEFGFNTLDDEFSFLVDVGIGEAMLTFEPGSVYDFAIHRLGAPDDEFLKMSQVGIIDFLFDAVDGSNSVDPMIGDDYFRSIGFSFDVDGNPDTREVSVSMSGASLVWQL